MLLCKFVLGLLTKKCKLFLGRDTVMGNLTRITKFKHFSGLTITASKSLQNSNANRYHLNICNLVRSIFLKTRYCLLLTYIFFITTINIFGQVDSLNHNNIERNRIDSLTYIIDKHNPTKKQLAFMTALDSIVGEQTKTIEVQKYKKLSKYSLKTNNSGTRMDIDYHGKNVPYRYMSDILLNKVLIISDLILGK